MRVVMRVAVVAMATALIVPAALASAALTPTENARVEPGTALGGPCQNSDATTGKPSIETLFFGDDGPPPKGVSHSQPYSGEAGMLGTIQPTYGCHPSPSPILAPQTAGYYDMRIDTTDPTGTTTTTQEVFFHVGCVCATSISTRGRRQLEAEEKLVEHPYNDQENYCTIGVGHLLHTSPCTAADRAHWRHVTRGELDDLFRRDLPKYEGYVTEMVRKLKLELDQCQFDALVNLAFNAGPNPFRPGSGIYKSFEKNAPIGGDLGVLTAIYHEDWGSHAQRAARAHRSARTKHDLAIRHTEIANEFATYDCPCRLP